MDSVSAVQTAFSMRESAALNQRQVAVAANAARSEQAVVAELLQAIQVSTYNPAGQAQGGPVPGSSFSGVA